MFLEDAQKQHTQLCLQMNYKKMGVWIYRAQFLFQIIN